MSTFEKIPTLDPLLKPILVKVSNGERLSREDGLLLEETSDLHSLCMLADSVRERIHGNRAGYIINAHVDYTNVCISRCKFCAFFRDRDSEDAYVLTPTEAAERVPNGIDEIHLVGGINPDLAINYFIELLQALHDAFPDAALKAFTAVEIQALAERENLEIRDILVKLKNAGLAMIPGGGAEIFDENLRSKICPNKAASDEWLNVHRIAHEMGIPSNSTMLHGHIENAEHRIDHLLRLRGLQDESGGFVAHIPLPFLTGANELAEIAGPPNGTLDIRQIAIARLMLDNIPHIKAYWRAMGIKMAQIALRAGADDLDGTVGREDIMHQAGSDAPRGLSPDYLVLIIRGAGLEPYRRDSIHSPVKVVPS